MHRSTMKTSCFEWIVVTCAVTVWVLSLGTQASGITCTKNSNCGWMSVCNRTCTCDPGFSLLPNGKDCKNASCTSSDCLQCSVPDQCIRCVNFIAKSTGECLQKCEGSAEMQGDSLVCTESPGETKDDDDDDDKTIIYAIVGGVAAGLLLCIIVIIIFCIYIRRTRRNVNLQSKSYSGRHMDTGNVKKFSVYDNHAFALESDASGLDYRLSRKLDPLEYQTELERLRPHMDTLMGLLSETRAKTRAMKESDPRLPTYKGMIHQLCRVLVLLHKKDPIQSLPSDALSLVQWGHQMVDDARQQEMACSDPVLDFPTAQISSVDIDPVERPPMSPVYATPDGSADHGFPLPPGQASPYSSVPVPLGQAGLDAGNTARRPGFATINRTPSIPSGAIAEKLEFSLSRADILPVDQHLQQTTAPSTFSPYQQYNSTTDTQQPVAKVTREDLRDLLISNRDSQIYASRLDVNGSPSGLGVSLVDSPESQLSPRASRVAHLDGETVITGGEETDHTEPNSPPTHQASKSRRRKHNKKGDDKEEEEEEKFNTFGRKTKLKNLYQIGTDDDVDSSPVLRGGGSKPSTIISRPVSTPNFGHVIGEYQTALGSEVQTRRGPKPPIKPRPVSYHISNKQQLPPSPPLKKNIITNPKAIKATSFSAPGSKKPKQYVKATTGYFANGHFYDPNPMPGEGGVEGEVYAPGSNYSDHSAVMSTFLGDLPRSRSQSSSNQSEGADSENSGGDLDVFPFDPNDATDPVEV